MVLSINIFQYGYKNQREGVNIPGFWTRMQTIADGHIFVKTSRHHKPGSSQMIKLCLAITKNLMAYGHPGFFG
jgi:hypothetical protein